MVECDSIFCLFLEYIGIEVGPGEDPAYVIGDAYEYMVGEFAAEAGKKAGSFFTPSMVSELMGKLTGPRAGDSIYDPTCGSASLLIRTARQAGNLDQVAIYGQEMNGSSWSMARMNLFIHGIHVKWKRSNNTKNRIGSRLCDLLPVFTQEGGNHDQQESNCPGKVFLCGEGG